MAYEDALEEMGRRMWLECVLDEMGDAELAERARGERRFAVGVVAKLTGRTRAQVLDDMYGWL